MTMFWGVGVRSGGRGQSVTQTLTSVSAVPRVEGPTRCVRTPPDPTDVFVKQDLTKLHQAIAQVCLSIKRRVTVGPGPPAVTRVWGVTVRLSLGLGGCTCTCYSIMMIIFL